LEATNTSTRSTHERPPPTDRNPGVVVVLLIVFGVGRYSKVAAGGPWTRRWTAGASSGEYSTVASAALDSVVVVVNGDASCQRTFGTTDSIQDPKNFIRTERNGSIRVPLANVQERNPVIFCGGDLESDKMSTAFRVTYVRPTIGGPNHELSCLCVTPIHPIKVSKTNGPATMGGDDGPLASSMSHSNKPEP
jgi:hypothetical protein